MKNANAQLNTGVITIPQAQIHRQAGVIILPLSEYQKLFERAFPDYYLQEKQADDLDKLVKEGLTEYQTGKTKTIASLKDLD